MKNMKRAMAIVGLVFLFSSTAMAKGASTYASKCTVCHGVAGAGTPMGPKLAGSDFIKGDAEVIKALIANGVSGGDKKYPNFSMGMPKFVFSDGDLSQIVAYLKTL